MQLNVDSTPRWRTRSTRHWRQAVNLSPTTETGPVRFDVYRAWCDRQDPDFEQIEPEIERIIEISSAFIVAGRSTGGGAEATLFDDAKIAQFIRIELAGLRRRLALDVLSTSAGAPPDTWLGYLGEPAPMHINVAPSFNDQVTRLMTCLSATPVEDGVRHEGEDIARELVISYVTKSQGWFDEMIEEARSPSMVASIIRLLGRIGEVPPAFRSQVVESALKSRYPEVRDAAIQAVDLWEDKTLLKMLQGHCEPLDWIYDYQRSVIRDLVDKP